MPASRPRSPRRASTAADASAELTLLLTLLRTQLRAPDFGPDEDFLAHGGDSLGALRISGTLREHGLRLRPSDLLTAQDARTAASRIVRP
ncbi:acyl carrier protein [Streptomyces sp. NPDC046985]|uniref:acyl carrier protein n=1 Tax=Streptomyces sp. NPDC046985 TaxID=3155377 RepID=UPI0033DC7602